MFFYIFADCGKSFRYKVSQRSHKCSRELAKQSGEDSLRKFILESSILAPSTITSLNVTNDTAEANKRSISIHDEPSHELCLENFFKENSNDKVTKNDVQNISRASTNNEICYSSVEAFDNLTLNSNHRDSPYDLENFYSTLETINEDSIKDLLGALR
jgi:hypothetical protein